MNSRKIKFGDKEKKLNDDVIQPLCVILSQMNGRFLFFISKHG